MTETFLNGRVTLHCGENRAVLNGVADCSIDSIVTDPPYALVSISKRYQTISARDLDVTNRDPYRRTGRGFMGKQWDNGETAFATEFWAECLRVLKPGGHVVAFSGTRTYHRMACAIEDAGFEIRDQLQWVYSQGFPKSHDVSKGIDRAAGAERRVVGVRSYAGGHVQHSSPDKLAPPIGTFIRAQDDRLETAPTTDSAIQWQGWGTALKPACEPICLARKPLIGTVAANVLEHGTGAINIDGCRVDAPEGLSSGGVNQHEGTGWGFGDIRSKPQALGRWPANILHDGSHEVIAAFPEGFASNSGGHSMDKTIGVSTPLGGTRSTVFHNDSGSAARFFYTAKADANDRIGSKHPTVKPVDLMQWLVRLVTPKGGLVLDPFAGTGTTAEACFREGMRCTLIERETEYQADIRRRMALVLAGPDERARESIKAKLGDLPFEPGSLFA